MFKGSQSPLAMLVALALLIPAPAVATIAQSSANEYIERAWVSVDGPVSTGAASRSWVWGPTRYGDAREEPYAESPNGSRIVQYFDKSRMEITNPAGDPASPWYVTNGLLVVELVTGQLQIGDNTFQEREPAEVNVAGDADDANGPTYATFATLLDAPPSTVGNVIINRVDRAGNVIADPGLATRNVAVAQIDYVTGHSVAQPFFEFMYATGIIWNGSTYTEGRLFPEPISALGRPISEPYWATAKVANTEQDVLLQCFERRCVTYTPGNSEGWQVEAGNVGRHYYKWRYEGAGEPVPTKPVDQTTTPTPGPVDQTPTPVPIIPTPPLPPHSAPLVEPILTPEWLDPYWTVYSAFNGDTYFANLATVIAGLYNLVTTDLGYWNQDTRAFRDWLQVYAASYKTDDGRDYRRQIQEHTYAQMMIGIYQPDTNLGKRIRSLEAEAENDRPGFGPQIYWDLLIGPAWWSHLMHFNEWGFSGYTYEHFWDDVALGYSIAQEQDPTMQDFGAYLASRSYSIDTSFVTK